MNKQRLRLVLGQSLGLLVPPAPGRRADGGRASGAQRRLGPLVCATCAVFASGGGGSPAAQAQNSVPPLSGRPHGFGPDDMRGAMTPAMPTATATARSFEIRGFELDDQAGLPPERLARVQAIFDGVRGPARTLAEVTVARISAQALLDETQPGALIVNVPEQTLEEGRIRVVLLARQDVRLDRLSIVAAPGFDERNVRASVPALAEGMRLDANALDRQLRLGELNPFKRTSVALGRQGDGVATAVVTARAERGALGFASTDNFGPRGARARLGAGYVDGNLTGRDDVLSLNTMSALHAQRLHGLSVSYALPLYRHDQLLELGLAHSRSDSGRSVELFRINGAGTAASLKWSYLLPRQATADLRLTAGYLYHRTRGRIGLQAFEEVTSQLAPGATAPLSVGVEGEVRPTGLGLAVVVSGAVNVAHNFAGRLGSTDEAGLRALRRGAGDFTLASARLRAEAELGGGWQLRGSVLGQTTGDVLVAADQLNVAGPYAVRGFRDAGLLGDRALVTSAEAATPVLLKMAEVSLRGWGFADYGTLRRNHALVGELARADVASAGMGLRTAAHWGTLEMYLARKFTGRAYDLDLSRYSLWVNAAVKF